jgi:hypothetical protein
MISALPARPDIDSAIETTERNLAAASFCEANAMGSTQVPASPILGDEQATVAFNFLHERYLRPPPNRYPTILTRYPGKI